MPGDVLTEAQRRERDRVRAMLERDRADAEAETRRRAALIEIEEGRFVNIEDATVPPTPEWLAKGETRAVTVDKAKGTVRAVRTVRRVLTDRLVELHRRGVIDDDQFAACVWYRRMWQATKIGTGPKIAQLGAQAGGTPRRDHLPPTEAAWEAWHLFRYARDGVPADVRRLFDLVVLDECTIDDASRRSRCGFRNGVAAFRRGALELHGAISHLLPVRTL